MPLRGIKMPFKKSVKKLKRGAGSGSRGNSDGMPMKCPRKLLGAGAALCLGLAALLAVPARKTFGQGAGEQPSLQTQDPRGRIRTTVSLVVVPVTVKNSAGELVTDLQQNDFRVFEDGIEQPIAQFSADPFPLSAAILIDDDLKQGTAEKVQKTLETLAGGFSASDEVSLWRFDQVPEQISEDFIAENDKLLTQLKQYRPQQFLSRRRLLHDDGRPARQHGGAYGAGEDSRRKPTGIPTPSTSTTRFTPPRNSCRTGPARGAKLFS